MKFPLAALYRWYRQLVRNPQTRWWVVLGTIVYLISPFDVSPDLFPFAGQIDDFFLITLLLSELFQVALSGSDAEWEEAQNQTPSSNPNTNSSAHPQDKNAPKTIDVDSVTLED